MILNGVVAGERELTAKLGDTAGNRLPPTSTPEEAAGKQQSVVARGSNGTGAVNVNTPTPESRVLPTVEAGRGETGLPPENESLARSSDGYVVRFVIPPEGTPFVGNVKKRDRSRVRKKDRVSVPQLTRRNPKHIDAESIPSNSVCYNDPCGTGVACSPRANNTFICVCSDGTVIKPGKSCPYVKPVNVTPPAVSMSQSNEHSSTVLNQRILLSSSIISLLLLLSVIFFIGYWKRSVVKRLYKNKRKLNLECDESVIKFSSFYPTNVTSNPNYCSASPVDLLQVGALMVPRIPKQHILFQGEIGQGQFGRVYKGELMEPVCQATEKPLENLGRKSFPGKKETVAVKVLKEKTGSKGEVDFQREVKVASMFKHDNILKFIGIVVDDSEPAPWMIFEFMPHGDLARFLRSSNDSLYVHDSPLGPLTEDNLMKMSIDICCGMEHLAGKHYIHRDLACRNCLVGANLTVKISDFGMSRDVYTNNYYKVGTNGAALPIRWMSPETILFGKSTLENDVWAFGITLWEVYSFAKLPYYGSSNEEVLKKVVKGEILSLPEVCPHAIAHVMSLCWKPAEMRPTFAHILPYLKAARQNPSSPQFLNQPQNPGDLSIYAQLSHHHDTPAVDHDSYLVPMMNEQAEYLTVQ